MADLTQKVLGYRFWSLRENRYEDEAGARDGFLYGQGYSQQAWGLGVNEATCASNKKHDAVPDHVCTCGLHAYFEPQVKSMRGPFTSPSSEVYGAIAGWGQMEAHVNGFRAQYAEIIALAYNDNAPRRGQEVVRAYARDYEVECVPLSRLTACALEQADPMPKALIPEKPKPSEKKKGMEMSSLSSLLRETWNSPMFYTSSATIPLLTEGKTPESIGLHSAKPGDVLKYGKEAA